MSHSAIIFDLGNTLVSYYTREQWPGVLSECIAGVRALLVERGESRIAEAELSERVARERGERDDLRVVPLEEKLGRIFDLPPVDLDVCRRFMRPIFALASRYDDVLPTLAALRVQGLKLGILSNSPWGSPAELWREELARHGLIDAVDAAVFCGDVGWRKPDPRPFEFVCRGLDVAPADALFIGDDPRWDIVGPERIGMDAILIDRAGDAQAQKVPVIRNLRELPEIL